MSLKTVGLCGVAIGALALAGGATAASKSLVRGLDGGEYLPYKASLVRETQQKLEHEGLYKGQTDGVLDAETMRATAEFQKQNDLQASGVPTPRTREKLGVK